MRDRSAYPVRKTTLADETRDPYLESLSASARVPQDAVDLRGLLQVITPQDTMLAVDAAAAIERAGANRGRDLRADLDTWLARSRA